MTPAEVTVYGVIFKGKFVSEDGLISVTSTQALKAANDHFLTTSKTEANCRLNAFRRFAGQTVASTARVEAFVVTMRWKP